MFEVHFDFNLAEDYRANGWEDEVDDQTYPYKTLQELQNDWDSVEVMENYELGSYKVNQYSSEKDGQGIPEIEAETTLLEAIRLARKQYKSLP